MEENGQTLSVTALNTHLIAAVEDDHPEGGDV
jgi:hypothetical protein